MLCRGGMGDGIRSSRDDIGCLGREEQHGRFGNEDLSADREACGSDQLTDLNEKPTRCDLLYAIHRFVEVYGGEEPNEERTSLSDSQSIRQPVEQIKSPSVHYRYFSQRKYSRRQVSKSLEESELREELED